MTEALTVLTSFDPPAPAADKYIEVVLAWYIRDYKVIAISNTTSLKPGMWLTPALVEKLAQTPRWRVSVGDNDVVSHVFALLAGAKGAMQ